MKIVIPGGAGLLGTLLAKAMVTDGHEVIVLSRHPTPAPWKVVAWDGVNLGPWTGEFEGADVVINLAGRSVNCRYGVKNRREITESRTMSTHAVGTAIALAACPPRIWLQASTATIYSHRYDAPNDETTGIVGGSEENVPDTWRFSIDVAKAWEQAANDIKLPNTRLVLMRTAMVMSTQPGGVFDILLGLVRKGLGGTNGDGHQFVSWIHEQDFIRAINWLIDHEELAGAVNICSPNPLPNAEFMRAMRQAWGIRIGLPATQWMLAIGAFFLRTETELILKSRRVMPGFLLQSAFKFQFPTWEYAAADLCARWRERKAMYCGSSREFSK